MILPEYQPRYGLALWFGSSIVDVTLYGTGVYGQDVVGGLSLFGFAAALTWALGWGWWRRSDPVEVGGSP